ncbi:endonuclease [Marinobacterium aestuarii]|uniref:Endonuclease n=1 Tax=Marinobacterium aestuarii TaxID=1821621 RepID=A0A1A9EXH2_9GAMM|nr:endonuclease [Marinobacterium aestuarii]
MRIVDLSQRTPAWHQWRNGGITASEAPVIMDRSPYKTPWRLWAEKTALVLPDDLSANPNVQRGIQLEPKARLAFEQAHQDLLLPLCAEADHNPLLRASFDGINNAGEPVELKCPTANVFEEVRSAAEQSSAYQLYWVQVQHQILVANASRGWLAFFYADELIEFEIARDDAFLVTLEENARQFWTLIQTRQEPAKCPERDYFVPAGADQSRWAALSHHYLEVNHQAKALEQQLNTHKQAMTEVQQRLVAMMGAFAHAEYAGIKLCRYWVNGTVDYPALIAEQLGGIDEATLSPYRKPAAERIRLTVTQPETTDTTIPATVPTEEHTAQGRNTPDNQLQSTLSPQQPRSFYF